MIGIAFFVGLFVFETGSEYIALGLKLELILLFLPSKCWDYKPIFQPIASVGLSLFWSLVL